MIITPVDRTREAIRRVCEKWRVSVAEFHSKRRFAAVVEARREVAKLLRDRGMSLPAIGLKIGRSHWTVLYLLGCAKSRRHVSWNVDPETYRYRRARYARKSRARNADSENGTTNESGKRDGKDFGPIVDRHRPDRVESPTI